MKTNFNITHLLRAFKERGLFVAVLATGLLGNSAYACSIMTPEKNLRVKQARDCSFINAGPNDFSSGARAVDAGNNKVTQIVTYLFGSAIVVTDCQTGEGITVHGKADAAEPRTTCPASTVIEPYLASNGGLRLNSANPLIDFVMAARRMKLPVDLSGDAIVRRFKAKDKYDAFCGCKLFYPNSVGANS
ncbi:MAG: hypothetical protein KUG74_13390 [Rhodobacteraceae bacterium]|nr:hypothetical protein [Paracoccaceae bacterium]